MWLRDYHVDGLRLDAVHAIVDTSAVHILEELARRGRRAGGRRRPAAVPRSPRATSTTRAFVRGRDAGGYGLDAQWSDDFHHALHAVLTGERDGYYEDFGSLGAAGQGAARRPASTTATLLAAPPARATAARRPGLPGDRVRRSALQNHDQVGNRAAGERIERSS